MLLRILGPGVVASTLGLLASGLVLILLGRASSRTVLFTALGQRVDWLTLHQGLFLVWAVLTGLHVLARTVPALQLTVLSTDTTTIDGTNSRAAVLAGSAVVAAVAAVLVLSASGSWRGGEHHGPPRIPGHLGVSTQR